MTPEEADRLAAEHVLGLLDTEETARAEERVGADPDFASLVAAWRERLAELDGTAPALPPPDALWTRIAAGLEAGTPQTAPAPVPVIVPDPSSAFRALWRNLAFWRVAGLAGAAASLLLALGLVAATRQVLDERARKPLLVAVLVTEANKPLAIVNAFAGGRAELVTLAGVEIPHGHALEVWTFPDATQRPVSVGLVRAPRSTPLDLSRVPAPHAEQVFAVSVEPANGSPTGLPTGPVLMKGTASTAL